MRDKEFIATFYTTLLFLHAFSLFTSATGQALTANSIRTAHWLLRNAEDMHRSFKVLHGVEMVKVFSTGSNPKQICKTSVHGTDSSRKLFEESWTGVMVSGTLDLDAVFDGSCFATAAQSCAIYSQCETAGYDLYPEVRDMSTGLQVFNPNDNSLEALRWAVSQDFVESWQMEEQSLVQNLPADQSSNKANYLKNRISAAVAEVDKALHSNTYALVKLVDARVIEFDGFVKMAPSHSQGTPLPQSFLDFAASMSALVQAMKTAQCSHNNWAGLRQDVVTRLESEDDAIAAINADTLLQIFSFDYTWRVAEAVLVSASLALQTVVLSTVVETNCLLDANPYSAAMADFSDVQTKSHALIEKLKDKFPLSPSGSVAPLQRCLSSRVAAAMEAVSASSMSSLIPSSLLPLDFCKQLFDATANQVISLVPYTEAAPPETSMSFIASSTEQREIHFDSQRHFAYVDPYASVATRPPGAVSSKFAADDKVIQLHRVDASNVRAKGAPSPQRDCCEVHGCQQSQMDAMLKCWASPCPPGCVNTGSFYCDHADFGYYSLGGQHPSEECPNRQQIETVAQFVHAGWHNSSCPFVCKHVDAFQQGDTCISVGIGWYSESCENEQLQCQTPVGMDESVFKALVAFTSPGLGTSLGCEISLAFPLVVKPPAVILNPPFTVELFVKVAVSDIPSAGPTEFAILTGVFPRWFVGLRRASDNSVKITFYHAQVTLTSQGRQSSLVDSQVIPWSTAWHHIAVVVSSRTGSPASKNIYFYLDGVEVDAAYRSVIVTSAPQVQPDHNECFHIGPPNIQLFPSVLQEGRAEPYFNVSGVHSFYEAEIDEVRIHNTSLNGFTSGFFLTELSRREACDLRTARLDGHCKPRSMFTPNNNLNSDRSYCAAGYEPCGSHPGMCLPSCKPGMLRLPDCTCDCATGQFQVWFVKVIHLTGSGRVRSVLVYDSGHQVIANKTNWQLNDRIDLGSTKKVAVVVVRGGASATEVTLEVETADGARMSVPSYQNVKLPGDRDVILLHERVNDFFDMSFECVDCPGESLGSSLPRMNALSCSCADGYDGRNLLGACVPRHSRLPPPAILPSEQYQTAGTLIQLTFPSFQTEGSWLAVIRYEWLEDPLSTPTAPNCESSPRYDGIGLDIIKREKRVVVRAVLCHPLHFDSNITEMTFTGNKHLDPPACSYFGTKSTPSTYFLGVAVSVTVDNEPGATIKFTIDGGVQQTYVEPLRISKAGTTEIIAQASKDQFDDSMPTTCRFSVDGPPRVSTPLQWVQSATLAGFIYENSAFLVHRSQTELRFELQPNVPGGVLSTPVQTEFRLWHRSMDSLASEEENIQDWTAVGSSGSVHLDIAAHGLRWALHTTTLLRIEWRTKETGYIWSSNQSIRLILLGTKAAAPTTVTRPSEIWNMGDSWTPGPLRDAALRQLHDVEIHRPAADAQIVFGIGTDAPTSLLTASLQNASSLRNGGLVQNFLSQSWSPAWTPDELSTQCISSKLCYYSGQIQVRGGETVYAYSLQPGKLESEVASWTIPKDLEPARDDQSFVVSVSVEGAVSTITQSPGVYVLPSVAENFTFSLDRDAEARKSCVLYSFYADAGSSNNAPGLQNCTWLEYQGKRTLQRNKIYEFLQVGATSSLSINVTILTTIKKPGMLWAYPRSTSYLWLRNRAASPAIEIVLAPAPVPAPAAMIWLPLTADASMSAQVAAAQPIGTSFQCFFTVNYVNVGSTMSPNWLNAVPNFAGSVTTVADSLQKTSTAMGAKTLDQWRDDIEKCAWPSICEMPLSGTLSVELIRTPSALPIVCAWVMAFGYSESTPTCVRIEASTKSKEVKPTFSVQGQSDVSLLSVQNCGVTKVGRDEGLDADVLRVSSSCTGDTFRRRLSGAPDVLNFLLDRSHPLQYRHASVATDPASIICCAQGVLSSLQTTASWKNLTTATPEISFPLRQKPEDHAVFAVYVKLLIGINSWSSPTRSTALVLLGEHPDLTRRQLNRTIFLQSPLATSKILYRWTLEIPQEPPARSGGSLYTLKSDFHALEDAYVVDARLGECVIHNITEEAKAAKDFGPRLCNVAGNVEIALPAPDHRRWGLWAAAYSEGLPLSPAVLLTVEAQCVVGLVANAVIPLCQEGERINSGSQCTPRCSMGYLPSETVLSCHGGNLLPSTFSCQEAPCQLRGNISDANLQSCREGGLIPSGSQCTPWCLEGYVASVPDLKCDRGVFSPDIFACLEASCTAPENILRAAAQPCSGLAIVPSGRVCQSQCHMGYIPSVPQLTCSKGVLSPSNFKCLESPCEAPSGVRFASSPPCEEGAIINPMQQCTPRCQIGYSPSELSLACSEGVLRPATFACDEIPCATPADIVNGEVPACKEGQRIAPGGICTPRCQQGYEASLAALGCGNGSLSPSTFECMMIQVAASDEASMVDNILIVGVIVIAVCWVGLCAAATAWFARRGSALVVLPEEDEDVLSAWLECVMSVDRGTCVFCGSAPIASKGVESCNGPMTIFHSCEFCAEVLSDQNIGCDSVGVASEIWNGAQDVNQEFPRLLGTSEDAKDKLELQQDPILQNAAMYQERLHETLGQEVLEDTQLASSREEPEHPSLYDLEATIHKEIAPRELQRQHDYSGQEDVRYNAMSDLGPSSRMQQDQYELGMLQSKMRPNMYEEQGARHGTEDMEYDRMSDLRPSDRTQQDQYELGTPRRSMSQKRFEQHSEVRRDEEMLDLEPSGHMQQDLSDLGTPRSHVPRNRFEEQQARTFDSRHEMERQQQNEPTQGMAERYMDPKRERLSRESGRKQSRHRQDGFEEEKKRSDHAREHLHHGKYFRSSESPHESDKDRKERAREKRRHSSQHRDRLDRSDGAPMQFMPSRRGEEEASNPNRSEHPASSREFYGENSRSYASESSSQSSSRRGLMRHRDDRRAGH